MKRGVLLHVRAGQRIAILEGENRLVLGAVVLVHAADVGINETPQMKQQEERDADHAVNHVEDDRDCRRSGCRASVRVAPPTAGTCT